MRRPLIILASAWFLTCSGEAAPRLDVLLEDATPLPDLSVDRAPVLIVDLRADVNRDGVVDLDDPGEDLDEDTWDAKHGAVFLANIDDDLNACPKSGTDVSLAACNDAADEVVNGADDALDLAPLKVAPWALAPVDTTARLAISDAARPYVRLFKKQGESYALFRPDADTISVDELRAGLDLALEGIDVVRDAAVWDGLVDITLTVQTSLSPSPLSDTVRLRLAPLVTQHHLSPPFKVFASSIPADPASVAMLKDLTAALDAAGIPQTLVALPLWDQWTQDLFETATMSMPAPGGPHVVYVYIRSANIENPFNPATPLRQAGQVVFSLRGKDVGAIQQVDLAHSLYMDSLDSFGNTETIPPYTLGEKSYPLGRLFRGSTRSFFPDPTMMKLLESQRVQPPVYVDTSWLLVGHVDETISFVKAPSPRGWALVVNDPALAKSMLEQASAGGHGAVAMFEGLSWLDGNNKEYPAEVTIDDVLADSEVMSASATAAVEIDNQIAILKKETGITDSEILRLPFLHWQVAGYALAYQVGTVNGVSLGDAHYGAADPHGPIIDGKDIFKKQMEEEFAKVSISVHWIEDWDLYHRLEGEIHCGSNIARQVSTGVQWWESGR